MFAPPFPMMPPASCSRRVSWCWTRDRTYFAGDEEADVQFRAGVQLDFDSFLRRFWFPALRLLRCTARLLFYRVRHMGRGGAVNAVAGRVQTFGVVVGQGVVLQGGRGGGQRFAGVGHDGGDWGARCVSAASPVVVRRRLCDGGAAPFIPFPLIDRCHRSADWLPLSSAPIPGFYGKALFASFADACHQNNKRRDLMERREAGERSATINTTQRRWSRLLLRQDRDCAPLCSDLLSVLLCDAKQENTFYCSQSAAEVFLWTEDWIGSHRRPLPSSRATTAQLVSLSL